MANWPDVRRFAWDTLTRARAIEDTCYVLAANRVGDWLRDRLDPTFRAAA